MSAPTAVRVVRFTASRDQACGSPWGCDGIQAGQRAAYVGGDSPAAYCPTCVDYLLQHEPQVDVVDTPTAPELCNCTRTGKGGDGFTNAGTPDVPRWVHNGCGLPAYLTAAERGRMEQDDW
ncbi:MAG: hypothetical protein ACRCZP_10985, partial [Phycicoccus sp.]